MNIWVEFYKYSDDRKNYYEIHTQMKESLQMGFTPDPSIISRRFFDKMSIFKEKKRMEEDGNMVSIKRDGFR